MAKARPPETLEEWKRRRREAREARRLAQRAANVGRALKMRAARLAFEKSARGVDEAAGGSMTAGRRDGETETARAKSGRGRSRKAGTKKPGTKGAVPTTQETQAARPSATPEIHVGCSGWYYWHWRDLFYPDHIPRKEWFAWYARHFDTVELNAPFYSWPTLATVRQWVKQIPTEGGTDGGKEGGDGAWRSLPVLANAPHPGPLPGVPERGRRSRAAQPSPLSPKPQPFRYTVKACELITHVKRFEGTQTLVRDFAFIAELLGPYLGCFLFQLPPSFHYSAARLRRIVEQLAPLCRSSWRNVVEFRHPSWWNAAVYRAFRRAGIAFCSTSGPRLPDELVRTADDVYIRFHGTKRWYRHDYSAEELDLWAERIRSSGARRVWAYFNNDREGFALKNATALRERLRME